MTPEERRLLQETHALARDNHRMLRSVRRHQLITDFGKFFLWVILIGIGAYYYVFSFLPILDKYRATGVIDIPATILGLPTSTEVQKLIDSYKSGQKP